MKQISVGRSKVSGLGIIAKENIKRGDLIGIIKGPIRFLKVRTKKQAHSGSVWIGRSKYTWIHPEWPFNYLNHSCEPSAGIKGRVRCFALRDISKGEEITVDYSTIEPQELWSMHCKCGSKHCRKIIRSVNYLPKPLYKKYIPFIPTYFQRMYEKSHAV